MRARKSKRRGAWTGMLARCRPQAQLNWKGDVLQIAAGAGGVSYPMIVPIDRPAAAAK